MNDLYIEARLQAIKEIASTSCVDEKDADNIASFCDEIYSAIEIVKQGGVSDVSDYVCDWTKIDEEGYKNCECNYDETIPDFFKYCPYCGKKILCKE